MEGVEENVKIKVADKEMTHPEDWALQAGIMATREFLDLLLVLSLFMDLR